MMLPDVLDRTAYSTTLRRVPEGWLTVTEAAKRKGLEPQQVRDLIKAGRLPAEKIGPIWMIRVEDIDALIWHGPGRPKNRRGRPPKKT